VAALVLVLLLWPHGTGVRILDAQVSEALPTATCNPTTRLALRAQLKADGPATVAFHWRLGGRTVARGDVHFPEAGTQMAATEATGPRTGEATLVVDEPVATSRALRYEQACVVTVSPPPFTGSVR
jgi:hypothetical protein